MNDTGEHDSEHRTGNPRHSHPDRPTANGRDSRPYLLVISQVYVPDPAAVGQYLAEITEAMVGRGWRVGVYAASRGYDDPREAYAARECRQGVTIFRLPFSSFGKRSIAIRLLAQSIFLAQAFLRGLIGPPPSLILVSTSPPFAGFVGSVLAGLRSAPLAWWVMDINPDQMVASGKLPARSLFARVFEWMNRVTLRRAATVFTLDRFMAERLRLKYPARPTSAVIPPWPLAAAIAHESHCPAFRTRHGLDGKFLVMYSGNHAIQHPLDTLLDAARELEDEPRVVFVFVGGGAGKAAVDRRIAAGATNLRSLPPVPLDELHDVLTAADIHVVTMGDDMVGIVHPSKIYSAMAIGRPILFFGPSESHAGELVSEHRAGWVVRHGDAQAAVDVIREAAVPGQAALGEMGKRASEAVTRALSAQRLRSAVCDLITEGHS